MVENYQQEQTLKEPETPNYTFATIGQIYDDGMSLIFPGAEGPSEKHYKANLYCKFKAGQRVYIAKDSGTYVVLFPVGVSGSESVVSDSAKTAETATKANTATSANSATTANTASKADKSDKLSTSRTISLSGAVTGSGSFDGSQNVTIPTSFGSSTVSRATTADRWTTSRRLTIRGDATGYVSMNGSSDVTLNVDVTRHSGNTLGFFNQSGITKRGVSNLASSATLPQTITKLNELIDDLQAYGLIGS